MTENTLKLEVRNQPQSQSDGFADVGTAKARSESVPTETKVPAATVDSIDDNAIRERAYQLYQESDRQNGHADEHWHQAERELKRKTA
jgi:hypothetical protein